jgi:hypothetical protein
VALKVADRPAVIEAGGVIVTEMAGTIVMVVLPAAAELPMH